jgi:hypothetical protein
VRKSVSPASPFPSGSPRSGHVRTFPPYSVEPGERVDGLADCLPQAFVLASLRVDAGRILGASSMSAW